VHTLALNMISLQAKFEKSRFKRFKHMMPKILKLGHMTLTTTTSW